jgi:hypothetical protein
MTEIRKQPLAYARGNQIPRRRIVSVPAVIISGAGVLMATVILILVVPLFEYRYKDFAMALSRPTMLVLDLSRAMRWLHWGILWAIPLVLGLLVPLLGRRRISELDSPRVRRLIGWNVALWALVVALVVGICLMATLVLPYIRFVHQFLK